MLDWLLVSEWRAWYWVPVIAIEQYKTGYIGDSRYGSNKTDHKTKWHA
jgi:hypothetical protein